MSKKMQDPEEAARARFNYLKKKYEGGELHPKSFTVLTDFIINDGTYINARLKCTDEGEYDKEYDTEVYQTWKLKVDDDSFEFHRYAKTELHYAK